jgi:general secretion pathway protein L
MIQKYFGNSHIADRMKSGALQGGRILRSILAFSPADLFVQRKQVAISIGWDAIQIAHGFRFLNRVHVLGYETHPLREDRYPSPETVAAMVSPYLDQFHMLRSHVMLCVPKAWSVIRTAELPIAAKENLSDVIAFELDRITPFTSEEAYYDFYVLEEGNEKLKVAVVAMRKDVASPYMQALSDKGLIVSHIDMNLSAIGTYLNYVYQEQNVVYLDIGFKHYEGGSMQSGVLISGCAGSSNGRGLEESFLADIVGEIEPWMQLKGTSNESPQLFVHLNNGLSYSGLERQLPWPVNVLKNEDPAVPGFKGVKKSEQMPHAAIGGVIALLWPKAKAYNLLQKRKIQSHRAPLALTVLLLIVLLAMGILTLLMPSYMENERIAAIDREIVSRKEAVKKIESLRKEYNALDEEVRTVVGFKQGKPLAVNVLRELTTVLPKSVWLMRVRVSESGVDIEGFASSATDILPLIEASPYFSKVEFTSPTIRDSRMNADRFIIRMEFEGVKREEPKSKNGKK